MEQSIRNAEKLIEATNMALSQMMQDSSFDDFATTVAAQGNRWKSKRGGNGKTTLSADFNLDDVRHLLGVKEKSIEELFNFDSNRYYQTFRQNSARRYEDKIEEINNKIEFYRQEQMDREERASLRELARCSSSEHAIARTISDTNMSVAKGRSSVRDDLKSKLKETQEIVDRGIQTARELRQTVEVLSDKPQQRWEDGSRSSEKPAKSDTTATAAAETKRCKRCHAHLKSNRRERRRENVSVTRMMGADDKPSSCRRLNTQQLPSLTIHGDLTCQRIPSVDIPPGKLPDSGPVRVNTALETYTHDQILRDRIERIMREFVVADAAREVGVRSVECLNCGKAVRVSDRVVDAERIDELLRSCDYNVFDPRIDEFVEGVRTDEGVQFVRAENERLDKDVRPQPSPRVVTPPPKVEEPVSRPRIRDLSRELTRRYNEKVVELDRDHMEFDRLIRDLLANLDEPVLASKPSLSVTTPVMLSYTGSGEEADDGQNTVLRPNRRGRTSKDARKTRELRTNCKVISSSCPNKVEDPQAEPHPRPIPSSPPPQPHPMEPERQRPVANIMISLPPRPVVPLTLSSESESPVPAYPEEVAEPEKISSPSPVPVKEPSDYESDFEDETMAEPLPDDDDERFNVRLSTITEVDSEVDRKLSDRSIRTKEIASLSSLSTDDDDTRKLLKKVNKDLKEVASQHLTATAKREKEVTEPLKEVLTALRNQFERTEHLAEKLTESIREVKSERDGMRRVDDDNDDDGRPEKQNGDGSVISKFTTETDILMALRKSSFPRGSEEEHELARLTRSKDQKSSRVEVEMVSPVGSETNKMKKSYSEGEISENDDIRTEVSSPSIGEIINENIGSDISGDDEDNSVTKFHLK